VGERGRHEEEIFPLGRNRGEVFMGESEEDKQARRSIRGGGGRFIPPSGEKKGKIRFLNKKKGKRF